MLLNCLSLFFLLFETGIAYAISSFKWQKIILFMKNRHLPNWIIWLTEILPQDVLQMLVVFY